MPSIDERVVSMAFENQVFESRVATTMATLSKLDTTIKNIGGTSGFDKIESSANKVTLQQPMSALDKLRTKLGGASAGAAEGLGGIDRAGNKVTLEGPSRAVDKLQGKMGQLSAGTTFTDIEKASSRVSLEGLTSALDNVTNKFSVLQGAASVALGGIASNAAMKGAAFAKSFVFGPLTDGLNEYKTNLGSIQTILANTEGQQVSGLGEVKKHLNELNTYSDQTIYNFSEMAKNIGTFTAAGVDMDTATSSIKGIANLAAVSGSNSQQASTAMYQLSQAIASGRVGLQDWNSVVNAGMGGAVFKKSLMQTAVAMGKIPKEAVKIDKATGKATINGESFRDSIMAKPGQESWLTSDVLTTSLKNFTGDMSEADLIAQGFTKTQAKSVMQQAKTAKAAATEVKTLSQAFDVAKETIGSGWAKTFELIFGDFEESKKTFTAFSNTLNGFINNASKARNKVLDEWKKLGGRNVLIQGIKNAFEALMGVIEPLKEAFRDIFPAQTGRNLFELTVRFTELMDTLKPSPETVDALRRIFAGLFAVVHTGFSIVKSFVSVIFDLFGTIGKNSGGFLGFVAGIGDFLVSVDEAITKGGTLKGFFSGLGAVLSVPLAVLKAIGRAIVNLFGGADQSKADGVAASLENVKEKLGPLKGVIDTVITAWGKLVEIVGQVKTALDPWFTEMADKLSGVGDVIADSFKGLNFDRIMEGLKVGLIGGIFVTLKKALGGGAGGGILGTLKSTLGGVNNLLGGFTKQLETMQTNIHAQTLLAIAAAIAILAAGIYILSTIDGGKLAKAMTAVAVGLGELTVTMKVLSTGGGKAGVFQLTAIAAGMVALSVSAVILAGAVKIFATMKWEDIAKGLVGIAGAIAGIGLAMNLMPGGGAGLVVQAAGLIVLAAGLNLIAAAVTIFSKMSWGDLAKGLVGVTAALVGIGLAVLFIPPTLPLTAAGLVILGVGLNAIALAVLAFGSMDLSTLAKGLVSITLAIAGIGLALALVPPTIGLTAVGLLIVGQAMVVVAGAIALLGSLSLGTLVKGISALGATLVVLASGLTLMIVSLPGAAALLVAAAALAALVPVMGILGTMKWSTIFKGLAAIAAVMVTIGIVGLLAAPGLIALGLALLPLGLGLMLVAKAAKIFATAISIMSDEGQKGFAVLLAAITGFIALIPSLVISLAKGILSIVDQIAVIAPKIVTALATILTTVIAFVTEQAPKLAVAIGTLVEAIAKVISENSPKLIETGIKLIIDLLTGISKNIGSVTTKAAEIVIKFFTAITAKAPKLIEAGVKLLTAFIQGITSKIGQVVTTVANMVVKFIGAVSRNIGKIIGAGRDLMIKFIGAIVGFVPQLIRKGTDMIVSFLNGIQQVIPRIKTKAVAVARTFITNLANGLVELADIGFRGIIRFLNGLARAIRENDDKMIQAGSNVADAIRDGLVKGLHRAGPAIIQAAKDIALAIPNKFLSILGIHSPSTVFAKIGEFTMLGYVEGIKANAELPAKQVAGIVTGMITQLNKLGGKMGGAAPSEAMLKLGKEIGSGFSKGLTGSVSDIRGAFSGLRTQLSEDIKTTRDLIKSDKEQLNTELGKQGEARDPKLIAELQAAIQMNTVDLKNMSNARRFVNIGLKEEKTQLLGLSKSYEVISAKLEAAKQALKDIVAERKTAAAGFTQQYSALPSIDDMTPEQFKEKLRERIVEIQKYHATLQALRKAGLDDTTYKMLLEQGTSGQQFADQLLGGGKPAIDEINNLTSSVTTAATTLGNAAADNLYDAGIKAAKGLVKGLKSQKGEIRDMMEDLAKAMVKAIKTQLKIKSPSEVFATVGNFVTQGLVRGLQDTSKVKVAATKLGEDVLSAMSDAIVDNIDVDPIISPVLDLSNVEKEAGRLDGMIPIPTVTATTSFDQAMRISDQSAFDEVTPVAQIAPSSVVTFEQNNYSPDPLSNIELYRQTNNQLARVKSMVGVS